MLNTKLRGIAIRPFFLWGLWTLLTGISVHASPVEAPHPVYGFLRRLEVRGILERPFLGSLPFQSDEVLALLRSAAADSAKLGAWERRELTRYLAEFDPELHRQSSRLVYSDSGRSLSGSVKYYAAGQYRDSLPGADASLFTAFSPHVEGRLSPNLSFVSEATVGSEKDGRNRYLINYDPQRGLPYNTRKRDSLTDLDNATTFDAFRTVMSWHAQGFGIDIGDDWNQWGPGVWQHPTFGTHPWFWVNDSLPTADSARFGGSYLPGGSRSGFRYPGESAPLTQLRIDFTWHAFKYTKFIAERTGLDDKDQAYVTAHRLEVRIGRNLLVGAHELVAFAGRSFEPIYAIPLVPLKFAEHQVGDKDNTALGLDMDYRLPRGMRVYGELFLDDLLGPAEILGSYWGNKYATVLGWEVYDLLLPSSCLQIEYARVEPWLFGHHHYDDQLQHYGSLLGSSIPPDSHAAWVHWSKSLPAGLSADLEYAFLQRALHVRGSSIFDFHENSLDGTTKVFLGGDPETRNAVRAGLSGRYGRYVLAKVALGYLRVDTWKGNPGTDLSGPSASGEVLLTY